MVGKYKHTLIVTDPVSEEEIHVSLKFNVWRENYGEDADGNRGQMTSFSELEDITDVRYENENYDILSALLEQKHPLLEIINENVDKFLDDEAFDIAAREHEEYQCEWFDEQCKGEDYGT